MFTQCRAINEMEKRIGDRSVIALLEPGELSANSHDGMEIFSFDLDISDRTVRFHIGATSGQVRLSEVVPSARLLSTKLALLVLERLREQGEIVACRKGCSACCSYLIPLSVPEAFRFSEEVLSMPVSYGSPGVLGRCLENASRILEAGMDESVTASQGVLERENNRAQASRVGTWYGELELECPLLSGGLCAYYEQRPTACREHIVTGSALLCGAEGAGESHVVEMPVSITQALGRLAGKLEGRDTEAVMLPMALPWVQDNLERQKRTWPARYVAELFVEILLEMAAIEGRSMYGIVS